MLGMIGVVAAFLFGSAMMVGLVDGSSHHSDDSDDDETDLQDVEINDGAGEPTDYVRFSGAEMSGDDTGAGLELSDVPTFAEIGGASGDDVLTGEGDLNFIHGFAGNDTITGARGADELHGESGDDYLNGGSGDDMLYGHSGADTLNGDAGSDDLAGGDGNDLLLGGSGDDDLLGNQGADTLLGGAGEDTLLGGLGDDIVSGVDFDTSLNKLIDHGDADFVNGGSGDDMLFAGANDTVGLGEGSDTAVVGDTVPAGQMSEITDFKVGEDKITVIYDDSQPTDLIAEFRETSEGSGAYELLINGAPVSLVYSDVMPSADSVSFVGETELVNRFV